MDKHHTTIEWMVALAESRSMRAAVWNPIVGCAPAGEGCRNCWAASETHMRRNNKAVAPFFEGLTKTASDGRAVFNGATRLLDRELLKPLRTRTPTVYFVCSRSDLFGEGVQDEWIDRVYAVMALCPQHLFLTLTKRPERQRRWLTTDGLKIGSGVGAIAGRTRGQVVLYEASVKLLSHGRNWGDAGMPTWPLPNVWSGVSIWDQDSADRLIPDLMATPTARQFVSAEPLLGMVSLNRIHESFTDEGGLHTEIWESCLTGRRFDIWSDGDTDGWPKIDWLIVGGESGPRARPMHPDWARSLRDQCAAAGVPFFFKQFGEWSSFYDRDIDDPDWKHVPSCDGQMGRGASRWVNLAGGMGFHGDRVIAMLNIGKKAADRLLDGREHLEVPS